MMLKKIASAAVLAAAISITAVAQNSHAPTKPPASPYQGWGLAISYEVIGQKCSGALSGDDVAAVKRFVAAGLAHSKATDSVFDHDKFARAFRAEMVTRYSDPRNCTLAIVENTRKSVAAIRELAGGPP